MKQTIGRSSVHRLLHVAGLRSPLPPLNENDSPVHMMVGLGPTTESTPARQQQQQQQHPPAPLSLRWMIESMNVRMGMRDRSRFGWGGNGKAVGTSSQNAAPLFHSTQSCPFGAGPRAASLSFRPFPFIAHFFLGRGRRCLEQMCPCGVVHFWASIRSGSACDL